MKHRARRKLNLIPVVTSLLLSVFILLMAPAFYNVYELGSPASKTENADLTLTFSSDEMTLSQSGPVRSFKRLADGKFDLEELRNELARINADSIKIEPSGELAYEEIISVMDSIRQSRKNQSLKILFGNLAK